MISPSSSKGLIWEVSHKDCCKGYIFGTIHLSKSAIQWPSDVIKGLIEECDVYAAEMDLSEKSAGFNGNYQLIPKGKSLEDYISWKKYVKAKEIINKAFGVNIGDYRYLQPILTIHLIDVAISGGQGLPLDQLLWNYAHQQNKKVLGLESLQKQIEILQQIPVNTQIRWLLKLSSHVGKYRKNVLSTIKHYNAQEIRRIYSRSKKSLGKYRSLFIYDRNEIMVESIDQLLKESKVFVAVGAGHLAGNKGILALLKRKGYRFKNVND